MSWAHGCRLFLSPFQWLFRAQTEKGAETDPDILIASDDGARIRAEIRINRLYPIVIYTRRRFAFLHTTLKKKLLQPVECATTALTSISQNIKLDVYNLQFKFYMLKNLNMLYYESVQVFLNSCLTPIFMVATILKWWNIKSRLVFSDVSLIR